MSIADLRTDYQLGQLSEDAVSSDPAQQFSHWLQQAIDYPVAEATAMCLSTVNASGKPSSRIVLLKNLEQGLWFFTHYLSRKGQEIAENPYACLNFFWQPLERQVRIEGKLHKLSERTKAICTRYFDTKMPSFPLPINCFFIRIEQNGSTMTKITNHD